MLNYTAFEIFSIGYVFPSICLMLLIGHSRVVSLPDALYIFEIALTLVWKASQRKQAKRRKKVIHWLVDIHDFVSMFCLFSVTFS